MPKLLRAVAVALCLLISAHARADNLADEADLAFQLGNEAFSRSNYTDALRNYFVSYRLVPNKNVLFNIARCYEALERYDEAYRYFNDLLQQELPSDDRAEALRSMQRLRPRVALVKVVTDPPGAEVFIAREDLGSRGRSPLSLALPPGRNLVRVRKDGYRAEEATVNVSRGREVTQTFHLELIVGNITVSGQPAGAWVREKADGPNLATVPGKLALPPGRHLLLIGAPHYTTTQYLVDVSPSGTTRIEANLPPEAEPQGKLVVLANRDNALIRVDGRESGFTPTVLTLPEGEHVVELTYRDLRPHVEKVKISRDAETKLQVELRYAPPPVQAASKRLLSVDDAPASTTVISSEELRGFGYLTLADALQAVRGMFLSYDYQYQYLGVRGFSPPGDLTTRVLILWDGHAMNDIWAGAGYVGRDLFVDLEEIDRIEVVRGPGSALYGTSAFFAVINVVPRDRLDPRRNVEVTGAVGALGLVLGHAATSAGSDPRRTATFSIAGMNASGAELTDLGDQGLVHGNDREKAYGGTARARFDDFTFHALINHRNKEVPTGPFNSVVGPPDGRTIDGRAFAEVRYDHDWSEASSVSARLYYDASRYNGHRPYLDDAGALYYSNEGGGADWGGLEARLRLSPFSRNDLTVGAEGQYQARIYTEFATDPNGNSAAPDVRSRTLISGYLLDEWAIHPRFKLSAGLRVDRYLDLSVTPVTPRLAIIARPYDGGLTKFVAGTAFRAPTSYELYYNDEGVSQVAALSLLPETIQTIELEHNHDLTEEIRLTVSGYVNRIQKLIVTTPQDGPPLCGNELEPAACLVNTNLPGTLQALGAEAELRWQPGRFALVDLSYSYVNIRSLDGQDAVTNLPNHVAAGRLMVPLVEQAVRLSTQAVYQSARYSERVTEGAGEALLVNVGISGEREHFRYFAGVQNLLDQRYRLPVNDDHRESTVPQYGRLFLVQLSASY